MTFPKVTVILLCGGQGTRMKKDVPKQFLEINQKIIAQYSLDVFENLSEVIEVVVVCEPIYRHLFTFNSSKSFTFAAPGKRRQDSVFNGLQAVQCSSDFICIHDSARPCIDVDMVQRVLKAAYEHQAATLGMRIKFTVKEEDGKGFVKMTPDRSKFWEIQTPQVVQTDLLKRGFEYINQNHLEVTDDVSIIELLGAPVKLVEGSYFNLKITTPDDLLIAKSILNQTPYRYA